MTTSATPFRLVIFDFDGTLADSGDWMVRTLNEIAGQFGLRHVSDEEVQMLRGRSNTEIVRYLGVPIWKLPSIATEMHRRIAADAAKIRLFDGVTELLQALDQRDLRLAIVSSNSEGNVRRILGEHNASRIDVYECSAAMFGKARKLKSVMKHLGIDARATLYIGDESRDIEAAHEVHVAVGAVTWGYAKAELLSSLGPAYLFNEIADIARAVVRG